MSTVRIRMLTLFALLLSTLAAAGNDGTYYTKGTQLVPLTESSISVRREVLTISLTDKGLAHVDVQYEFWNPEPQTRRLLMGFEADPPYNADMTFHPDGRHPYIGDFTVELNGTPLPWAHAACVADTMPMQRIDTSRRYYVFDNNMLYEDDGSGTYEPADYRLGIPYAYVYYFEADFQPDLNRLHHTYTYRLSHMVGTPYMVEYKLSPAARWAGGTIGDFTLVIRADGTAKHFTVDEATFGGAGFTVSEGIGKVRHTTRYGDPCTEVALRNGAVTLHIDNFRPEGELWLNAVGVEVMLGDDGALRIGATYDRNYPLELWPPLGNGQFEPADPSFRRRVLRNMPYAHRGRVFNDPKLQRYFESLWWYMPDPDYRDDTSDFTEVDWGYVKTE